MLSVEKIKEKVVPLAREYGLERVYLFGSYARGEATDASDVDLHIDQGSLTGMSFCSFYVDIEDALGCDADILTARQMRPNFLSHIKEEEILLYDRQADTAA